MRKDQIEKQITEWLKAGETDIKALLSDCYAISSDEAKKLWINYIDQKYSMM